MLGKAVDEELKACPTMPVSSAHPLALPATCVHSCNAQSPCQVSAGKPKMMWEALREAVDEELEADPTVLVKGAHLVVSSA